MLNAGKNNLAKLALAKQFVKNAIAVALFASGILFLWMKITLRNKVVVLMYHRVLPAEKAARSFSNPAILVDERVFEKHIRFLSKFFRLLSIENFCDHIANRKQLCGYNCLITFDDGWQDNYTHAAPILKKFGAPAVIFLPTDYIGSNNTFWQEQLCFLLYRLLQQSGPEAPILRRYGLHTLYCNNDAPLKERVVQYVNTLKQSTYGQINAMVQDISDSLSNQDKRAEPDKHMNWDQVKNLLAQNISFGSHAASHRMLTALGADELERELADSKQIISGLLNKDVCTIAYPNGNFNDAISAGAKAQGYEAAFTTISGYYSMGENPLQIKRINIHNFACANIPRFLCTILRIF